MPTNLKDLKGRGVLDLSTAKTIGKLSSIVFDPEDGRISALIVSGNGDAAVLRWDRIKAIGPDAITVETADNLGPPEGGREEAAVSGASDPLGRLVLTVEGDELGKVDDIAFDTEHGSVAGLRIGDTTINGDRLRAIGDYAVIVSSSSPSLPPHTVLK